MAPDQVLVLIFLVQFPRADWAGIPCSAAVNLFLIALAIANSSLAKLPNVAQLLVSKQAPEEVSEVVGLHSRASFKAFGRKVLRHPDSNSSL